MADSGLSRLTSPAVSDASTASLVRPAVAQPSAPVPIPAPAPASAAAPAPSADAAAHATEQSVNQAGDAGANTHGSGTLKGPAAVFGSVNSEDVDDYVEWDPSHRYGKFDKELGRGSSKVVFKAYDTDKGVEVAWNEISLTNLPRDVKEKLLSEVNILRTLDHDSILGVGGCWENKERQVLVFITELMSSGTLNQFIKQSKHVKVKVMKKWCRSILEGLKYLHNHKPYPIIHRDIKCDNIFINGHNGEVKIGDMGLATSRHQTHVASVLGTPEFMAPELYNENYDEKVDVYAFGMCVLEMITKNYPYSECTNAAQIFRKVTAGEKPAALLSITHPLVREFIELCLSNVDRRPSAEQLLSHRFFEADPSLDDLSVGSLVAGRDKPRFPVTEVGHGPHPASAERKKKRPPREQNDPAAVQGQLQTRVQVFVVSKLSPEKFQIKLRLKIGDNWKAITFPFDLANDSPSDLADELTQDMNLPQDLHNEVLKDMLYLVSHPPEEESDSDSEDESPTTANLGPADMLPGTGPTPATSVTTSTVGSESSTPTQVSGRSMTRGTQPVQIASAGQPTLAQSQQPVASVHTAPLPGASAPAAAVGAVPGPASASTAPLVELPSLPLPTPSPSASPMVVRSQAAASEGQALLSQTAQAVLSGVQSAQLHVSSVAAKQGQPVPSAATAAQSLAAQPAVRLDREQQLAAPSAAPSTVAAAVVPVVPAPGGDTASSPEKATARPDVPTSASHEEAAGPSGPARPATLTVPTIAPTDPQAPTGIVSAADAARLAAAYASPPVSRPATAPAAVPAQVPPAVLQAPVPSVARGAEPASVPITPAVPLSASAGDSAGLTNSAPQPRTFIPPAQQACAGMPQTAAMRRTSMPGPGSGPFPLVTSGSVTQLNPAGAPGDVISLQGSEPSLSASVPGSMHSTPPQSAGGADDLSGSFAGVLPQTTPAGAGTGAAPANPLDVAFDSDPEDRSKWSQLLAKHEAERKELHERHVKAARSMRLHHLLRQQIRHLREELEHESRRMQSFIQTEADKQHVENVRQRLVHLEDVNARLSGMGDVSLVCIPAPMGTSTLPSAVAAAAAAEVPLLRAVQVPVAVGGPAPGPPRPVPAGSAGFSSIATLPSDTHVFSPDLEGSGGGVGGIGSSNGRFPNGQQLPVGNSGLVSVQAVPLAVDAGVASAGVSLARQDSPKVPPLQRTSSGGVGTAPPKSVLSAAVASQATQPVAAAAPPGTTTAPAAQLPRQQVPPQYVPVPNYRETVVLQPSVQRPAHPQQPVIIPPGAQRPATAPTQSSAAPAAGVAPLSALAAGATAPAPPRVVPAPVPVKKSPSTTGLSSQLNGLQQSSFSNPCSAVVSPSGSAPATAVAPAGTGATDAEDETKRKMKEMEARLMAQLEKPKSVSQPASVPGTPAIGAVGMMTAGTQTGSVAMSGRTLQQMMATAPPDLEGNAQMHPIGGIPPSYSYGQLPLPMSVPVVIKPVVGVGIGQQVAGPVPVAIPVPVGMAPLGGVGVPVPVGVGVGVVKPVPTMVAPVAAVAPVGVGVPVGYPAMMPAAIPPGMLETLPSGPPPGNGFVTAWPSKSDIGATAPGTM